jgi:hypothetical protein
MLNSCKDKLKINKRSLRERQILLLHHHQELNKAKLKLINKNNSKLRLFQGLEDRMHQITSNTSKVTKMMNNLEVKRMKRARTPHLRMIRFQKAEEEEHLLSPPQRGDPEDQNAKFQARKSKATMRKMSMIQKKAQVMRTVNGKIDATYARELVAYFAVMDAPK